MGELDLKRLEELIEDAGEVAYALDEGRPTVSDGGVILLQGVTDLREEVDGHYQCRVEAVAQLAVAAPALHAELLRRGQELEETLARESALRSEVGYLKGREDYIATLLKVADGGQYRADWRAPIERLVTERASLRGELTRLRGALRVAVGEAIKARTEVTRQADPVCDSPTWTDLWRRLLAAEQALQALATEEGKE